MRRNGGSTYEPVHWRWLMFLLLVGLALSFPKGGRAPVTASPLRVQPALLQLAATHPAAPVRVIIQRQGHDESLNGLIRRLGGHVINNLSIVNGVVATLPAGAVPALAAASGVRWISPDGAVVQSSNACCGASTLQQV